MKKMIFALAVGLALVEAPQLRAQPSLDFGVVAPATGSISYAGGTNPLVGTAIKVAQVGGINGTSNTNVLPITGGLLNFNTGTSSGTGVWQWTGTSGNSFTITGSVAAQPADVPPFPGTAGPALLTGTILTASVIQTGIDTEKIAVTAFVNTVNATLANYVGLGNGSVPTWHGALNLSFFVPTGTVLGAQFTSTGLGSGDAITSPVPEPSSLAIAGLGALGLIGYGLRRRKAMGD